MPWILLKEKLPTSPSPPKLSIHFAYPWPVSEERLARQKEAYYGDYDSEEEAQAEDFFYTESLWGREPNEIGSWRISYKDTDLRVWRHECNVMTAEKLRMFIFGMEGEDLPSHELVQGAEVDSMLLRQALETDLRGIYDAALIDGCTPEMAVIVTMGINIEDADMEFPPIGWYRAKHEYASIWCYEEELAE